MENKIVLITNRGIRSNRNGATLFKNKLTKESHRLRCASVNIGSNKKRYKLSLQEMGQEENFIRQSIESGNGNPWVFFVHGNNQTLDKNLHKCFKIKSLFNVNVLAFSWPSVHHGKIRGFLNYIPHQPNIGMYATRQLKGKLKQYKKAKINAKLSAQDLVAALDIAGSSFESSTNKLVFISHSLGNYVVELSNQHKPLSETMSIFSTILLHQADTSNKDHKVWTDAIEKEDSVVITTNEKDKILEISNVYNHKTIKNKRLGNVKKETINGSAIYKDFTNVKNIGFSGHTIFLTPPEKNENVFAFFNELIGH